MIHICKSLKVIQYNWFEILNFKKWFLFIEKNSGTSILQDFDQKLDSADNRDQI